MRIKTPETQQNIQINIPIEFTMHPSSALVARVHHAAIRTRIRSNTPEEIGSVERDEALERKRALTRDAI
ncbi:hypothetical protein N7528_000314 [Penicillium herquei]|nr:hypothetical protein N7528_000314 [Penicillium herquei]